MYTTASPFEHYALSLQGVQSTDRRVTENIDNRNSYFRRGSFLCWMRVDNSVGSNLRTVSLLGRVNTNYQISFRKE